MKSTIIYFGIGGVGKTSIAKELQILFEEAFLLVGFDYFVNLMPEKFLLENSRGEDGLKFKSVKTNLGSYPALHVGEYGETFLHGWWIDEEFVKDFSNRLLDCMNFFIKLHAPLDILTGREENR